MSWVPVSALIVVALALLLLGRDLGLPDEVIGGLVGSLIGAAAILSGVLFDRHQRRQDEKRADEERRNKLKALITAELVNLAAGLIEAKRFADFAADAAERGHPEASPRALSGHLPRQMTFTNSLGVALLALSQREIDVLATLRANLVATETSMREEVEKPVHPLNLLAARKIQSGLQHDMKILAEAFREFAPERKFVFEYGEEPEFASSLLDRLSK